MVARCPVTIEAVKGQLQTSTASIDTQKARMRITRPGPVFPANRGLLRSSRASSLGSRCRRRPALRRRSTHCYSRAERRHTGILIVMSSRQRAMAQRQAGRNIGLWGLITLKVHIEILRRLGATEGPLTRVPQADLSSPRVAMDRQARTLNGIHRHQDRLAHLTQDHRSRHTRAMSAVVLLSRRRSPRARRAPAQLRARPAPCHPHKTRSTLRICRRMERNHLHIRATLLHRDHLNRPRQTHMTQIRI